MFKLFRTIVPLILVCFVFVYVLPAKAEASWFSEKIQAEDNEHITYQVDNGGDVRIDQQFKMSISAYYDDAPMTDLSIKDLKGFQLISSPSNGEFELKAPHNGGKEYRLLMEGKINNKKFTFTVPVSVKNPGDTGQADAMSGVLMTTMIVVAVVLVIAFIAESNTVHNLL